MSYDKTDWRPDYYVIIDAIAARNVMAQMGKSYDLWHSIDPNHIIAAYFFRKMFRLPKEVMFCRYKYLGLGPREEHIKFDESSKSSREFL